LVDDETNQSIHDRVFQTIRYLLRQRLELQRPVTYIDATCLTPQERAPYIAMGRAYGCDVEALLFDVPVEVCRERNRARARTVPDEAMELMAAKLVPPTVDEGFTRISVIGPRL
jgi:predicted kinase